MTSGGHNVEQAELVYLALTLDLFSTETAFDLPLASAHNQFLAAIHPMVSNHGFGRETREFLRSGNRNPDQAEAWFKDSLARHKISGLKCMFAAYQKTCEQLFEIAAPTESLRLTTSVSPAKARVVLDRIDISVPWLLLSPSLPSSLNGACLLPPTPDWQLLNNELYDRHVHLRALFTPELSWTVLAGDPTRTLAEIQKLEFEQIRGPGGRAFPRKARFLQLLKAGLLLEKLLAQYTSFAATDSAGFRSFALTRTCSAFAINDVPQDPFFCAQSTAFLDQISTAEFTAFLNPNGLCRSLEAKLRDQREHVWQILHTQPAQKPEEYFDAIVRWLRIRNLFAQWLQFRDEGLVDFAHVFRRGSTMVKLAYAHYTDTAFMQIRTADPGGRLRGMCLRVGSDWFLDDEVKNIGLMEKILVDGERNPTGLPVHLGIALHFQKRPRANPASAWPEQKRFAQLCSEGASIINHLLGNEKLAPHIFGIDVACIEESEANWPFVALLDHLGATINAARTLQPPTTEQPSIAANCELLCHAGEIFGTVLTGLRRVDDLARLVGRHKLTGGVGHGLVLGLMKPKSDYVRNIDWCHAVAWAAQQLPHEPDVVALVTQAVQDVLAALSRSGTGAICQANPNCIMNALELMHDPVALARCGFPYFFQQASRASTPVDACLTELLTNASFSDWMQTEEWRQDPAQKILETLREGVLKKMQYGKVVVEVCPSSNAIIALHPELPPFATYKYHPVSKNWDSRDWPDLTVNTDDPLQFGCNIAQETWYFNQKIPNIHQSPWRWKTVSHVMGRPLVHRAPATLGQDWWTEMRTFVRRFNRD